MTMNQELFQHLRDYLHLQIFSEDFIRDQKKALKKKAKKFKYDFEKNHLFHFTETQGVI
jgi:hypothetical protein